MPGQNDFHIVIDEKTGNPLLLAGLGKDEPSEDARRGARAAGHAQLAALKAEVEQAGEALSERERQLIKREQELEARERRVAQLAPAANRRRGVADE